MAIAEELGVSIPTVLLWRRRFKEQGLAGLADAAHPGRPRTYGRAVREQILATTLTKPEATTHWSRARLARQVGRERLDGRASVGGRAAQAAPDRDVQVQPRSRSSWPR